MTNYSYDILGRMTGVTDADGGTYDPLGRLAQLTRPNQVVTNYGYDALNRVTQITHGDNLSLIEQYTYTHDPVGNRTSITELDGTFIQYGYDARYRLTSKRYTINGIDSTTQYTAIYLRWRE